MPLSTKFWSVFQKISFIFIILIYWSRGPHNGVPAFQAAPQPAD